MAAPPATNDKYERIANLLAAGVPETQVADAVGLSPGRITQIKEEEEFQAYMSKAASAKAQMNTDLNDGWDGIERSALKILSDNMRINRNPEFALRVAAVANRATRRGPQGNQTLNAPTQGQVIVNLNAAFVNQLQGVATPTTNRPEVTIATVAPEKPAVQKTVNMLLPGKVQDVLLPATPADAILDSINIGDFNAG